MMINQIQQRGNEMERIVDMLKQNPDRQYRVVTDLYSQHTDVGNGRDFAEMLIDMGWDDDFGYTEEAGNIVIETGELAFEAID